MRSAPSPIEADDRPAQRGLSRVQAISLAIGSIAGSGILFLPQGSGVFRECLLLS